MLARTLDSPRSHKITPATTLHRRDRFRLIGNHQPVPLLPECSNAATDRQESDQIRYPIASPT